MKTLQIVIGMMLAAGDAIPSGAQTIDEDLLKRSREDRYYVQTHLDLGQRAFRRGYYGAAADHFRQAAAYGDRLDPADYNPWEELGGALERKGDTTGAAAAYAEAATRAASAGEDVRARIEGKSGRAGGAAPAPSASAASDSPTTVLSWIDTGERMLRVLRVPDSDRPAPDARTVRNLFERARARLDAMRGTPAGEAVKGGVDSALERCAKGVEELKGFEGPA